MSKLSNLPVYIMEAFALMTYLNGESAAQRVREILNDGKKGKCHIYMSIINLGEVLYNLERNYGLGRAQDALAVIQSLAIEVLPVDDQTVFAAAHIKANHPVSYADAFVIVAAKKLDGIVMIGDPEFYDVSELAKIEWLKSRK